MGLPHWTSCVVCNCQTDSSILRCNLESGFLTYPSLDNASNTTISSGWVILNTYCATASRSCCVIRDTNGGWCVGFSKGIGYWDSHVVVFALKKRWYYVEGGRLTQWIHQLLLLEWEVNMRYRRLVATMVIIWLFLSLCSNQISYSCIIDDISEVSTSQSINFFVISFLSLVS
jgi:hypothetical protein